MKKNLIAASILGMTLAACSSSPNKSVTAKPASTVPSAAKAASVTIKPAPSAAEIEAQKLDRIIRTLAANSIYFDYDKYSIKPGYMATLKHDYQLLKADPQAAVRLEGNCDERGSAEYNIALGQKRADSVRQALVALGIDVARVETVSFGKEKQRCLEHTQQCWAQNRRVDFAGK